jgi:hypothetical protein
MARLALRSALAFSLDCGARNQNCLLFQFYSNIPQPCELTKSSRRSGETGQNARLSRKSSQLRVPSLPPIGRSKNLSTRKTTTWPLAGFGVLWSKLAQNRSIPGALELLALWL